MGTFTDIIEDPIETETLLQFSTGPVSVQHLACNACSHWLQWAQLATTQLGQKKNSYIHHHKQSGSSYTAHQYNIYLYAFLSCFDDKSELSLKQKKLHLLSHDVLTFDGVTSGSCGDVVK